MPLYLCMLGRDRRLTKLIAPGDWNSAFLTLVTYRCLKVTTLKNKGLSICLHFQTVKHSVIFCTTIIWHFWTKPCWVQIHLTQNWVTFSSRHLVNGLSGTLLQFSLKKFPGAGGTEAEETNRLCHRRDSRNGGLGWAGRRRGWTPARFEVVVCSLSPNLSPDEFPGKVANVARTVGWWY